MATNKVWFTSIKGEVYTGGDVCGNCDHIRDDHDANGECKAPGCSCTCYVKDSEFDAGE